MTTAQLEERIAILERRMDELTQTQSRGEPGRDDWLKSVGMFEGNPILKEVMDEALRLREQARLEAESP